MRKQENADMFKGQLVIPFISLQDPEMRKPFPSDPAPVVDARHIQTWPARHEILVPGHDPSVTMRDCPVIMTLHLGQANAHALPCRARDWVATSLNYTRPVTLSLFEANIRIVGGLLSAYDLSADRLFLQKAEELVTCMMPNFLESPLGKVCSYPSNPDSSHVYHVMMLILI